MTKTDLVARVRAAVGPDGTIPVLSLWQPYCELVFAGRKVNETRGWRMPARVVGRDIILHATAKMPPVSEELHELCLDAFGCAYNHSLPLGGLRGIVQVGPSASTAACLPADDDDRVAGDWSSGRFASALINPVAFPGVLPMKGRQGWWKVEAAPLLCALESEVDGYCGLAGRP